MSLSVGRLVSGTKIGWSGFGKKERSPAFCRMAVDTRQTVGPPSTYQRLPPLYLFKENTIYSGGTGSQSVYVEYTDDSTAEDPIVRIRGEADSGAYDFTCHIDDIDPEHASYAEMCALWGHLYKTGEFSFRFGGEDRPVIPFGVDAGDITQKRNYMDMIDRMTTSQQFDQANQISAKELLDLYQKFAGGKPAG